MRQGANNYTRVEMTHLNSIIRRSYSSCHIIELLRGCCTPCRKEKKVAKEKNAEKWPGLVGRCQRLKGVRVSRMRSCHDNEQHLCCAERKMPLCSSHSHRAALTAHSVCLNEAWMLSQSQAIIKMCCTMAICTLAFLPHEALTVVGKTDK